MPAASSSASAGCCASLRMKPGKVVLPDRIELASAPKYPLRGHQLGYRPKTNSYDAWDLPQWERYIRDLAALRHQRHRADPAPVGRRRRQPALPPPPLEMMVGMSKICADYGLDVWIWYPAMDADYADPKTVEHALEEWGEVFRKLPRIDAVFVPGGDPGHTQPKYLMALLEKQAANLRRFHPDAQMWVSPQSFSAEWLDEFLALLKAEPAWLERRGLRAAGAGEPARAEEGRAGEVSDPRLPRHHAQPALPVPGPRLGRRLCADRGPRGDQSPPAGRVGDLPRLRRPDDRLHHVFGGVQRRRQQGRLERPGLGPGRRPRSTSCATTPDAWSACPTPTPTASPRACSRWSRTGAGRCWPTARSRRRSSSSATLERRVPPRVLANWRFQQALYRAYFDAYERSRLIHETDLRGAGDGPAARGRRDRLARRDGPGRGDPRPRPHGAGRRRPRARVFELAEALFQSIRMQLSVPRYRAISVGRGANLDTIDQVLNDREWLERRFAAIRKLDDGAERDSGSSTRSWTGRTPAPAGSTTTSATRCRRPHLVPGSPYAEDPASFRGPMTAFDQDPGWRELVPARRHALRPAAPAALRRPRPDGVVQGPRSSTPATCSR